MKGLLVLLCVVAAAQARSTAVQTSPTALAALGENPWVVHIRLAIGTSGLLNSCAGSLIDARWVLTSANCVNNSRFIWLRYGVVTVINPELVTESSAVRINPGFNAALISINRNVQSTQNIAPVPLIRSESETGGVATFCVFGENENGGAGEQLSCTDLELAFNPETIYGYSGDSRATRFDDGAPLVADGVQVGVLIGWPGAGDNYDGIFLSPARIINWIESETGIQL